MQAGRKEIKKIALKRCISEKYANDIRRLWRSVEAVPHEADGLWQNEQDGGMRRIREDQTKWTKKGKKQGWAEEQE